MSPPKLVFLARVPHVEKHAAGGIDLEDLLRLALKMDPVVLLLRRVLALIRYLNVYNDLTIERLSLLDHQRLLVISWTQDERGRIDIGRIIGRVCVHTHGLTRAGHETRALLGVILSIKTRHDDARGGEGRPDLLIVFLDDLGSSFFVEGLSTKEV